MLRYAVYARKSNDDRRVTEKSIGEQVSECRKMEAYHGLSIERIWEESRTAKIPDNRPQWSQLIAEVKAGRIDAILCWHINRLVRNMKEGGELVQLFADGAIKEIRTPHALYRTGDNILPLVLDAANATQYSIDLHYSAKRSMGAKAAAGGHNGLAAPGYLNARDPLNSKKGTIVKDPERFDLIRKAWELLLAGGHTVRTVNATLNVTWGYRSRQTSKRAASPMDENVLRRAFGNPFYAGFVRHEGRLVRGQHDPMVTADEFARAQAILAGRTFKAARTAAHPFTGVMFCASCGQQITAERKRLRNGKLWDTYHCSNSFRRCTSRGMSLEKVTRGIEDELASVSIDPELAQIGLTEILSALNSDENAVAGMLSSQEAAIAESRTRLNRLADMWISGLMTDRARYAELERMEMSQMNELSVAVERSRNELQRMQENAKRASQYVSFARREFRRALPDRKRAIARALGTPWKFDGRGKWIDVEPDALLSEFVMFTRSKAGPLEPTKSSSPRQELTSFAFSGTHGGPDQGLNEPCAPGADAGKQKRLPGSLAEALRGPLFPDLGLAGIEGRRDGRTLGAQEP